jgi:2-polyprenyl-3-methyl-5-hydroxy-6-metoxy-1,4-benzoquinol methylase
MPSDASGAAGPRSSSAGGDPVLAALRSALDAVPEPAVLDCGGGSGSFAVRLAGLGARVTVVDISVDALATLTRRAAEAGIAERVTAVQGDVEQLSDAVGDDRFDVVLAHGILEAVDDPARAFGQMRARLLPGGVLSVLVSNPAAAVLARALTGDLTGALEELEPDQGRVTPSSVADMCARAGMRIAQRHGIGIFTELVPGAAVDRAGAREQLAELERRCANRSPFADLAGRVHLVVRPDDAVPDTTRADETVPADTASSSGEVDDTMSDSTGPGG